MDLRARGSGEVRDLEVEMERVLLCGSELAEGEDGSAVVASDAPADVDSGVVAVSARPPARDTG